MKILIVDDDPIVVESCRRILKAEGIQVCKAKDAICAKKILDQEKFFDLMLTDNKMPGQDGFQLISQVRNRFPEMPILMMTGYLTPEIAEKGRAGGAEGFIAKPFTPEELLKAIENILSEHLTLITKK